ncbi:hypothetical protein EDD22DRAFT_921500 [Suillus occidentalis]|nr:hypothetical protein EDD22DRAFT_921500 [Suillus occidentalis]
MQDGRAPRIRNRAPAAIQRQESTFRAPKQRAEDFEELHEYRGRKRKEFEERARRTRGSIQDEFDRLCFIFERALDVDPRSAQLWLSYTEMELKSRNVQHARNLFDRAVTLLPRVDQLWYKYVYLEEVLQNVSGAGQVFERWMQWKPGDKAWQAYIKMEERYDESDRASVIYERWITVRPDSRVWVKWAKFEEERGKFDKAREVFQTAFQFFGDEEEQVEKAQARARVIYRFALSRLPRSKSANLYTAYTKFEKQHGTRSIVESTVLGRRRIQYEDEVSQDGRNYDVWFDYEEEDAAMERVRDVYERAVAHVPPGQEKRHWRRYIFLWLEYALFEEIETKDYDRARQVYRTVLNLVPHKQFTFAKLRVLATRFEIGQSDLMAAREILGTAIGMCPKEFLFKGYIQLEMDLRDFDRVRTLYEKYLEYDPTNSAAWIKYAALETALEDFTRAEVIFELGASQASLSMPEILWKAYIDFEVDEQGDREKMRSLYERLAVLSGHRKVWISYAEFEASSIPLSRAMREEEEDEDAEPRVVAGDPELARQVLKLCNRVGAKRLSSQRAALLESWKAFEQERSSESDVAKVEGMMPIIGRKQYIDKETGQVVEDWELVFADDEREANPRSFKFLQMAHAWKHLQAKKSGGTGILSGFTPATSVPESTQNDDVRMEDRREQDDSHSDVASSDGE